MKKRLVSMLLTAAVGIAQALPDDAQKALFQEIDTMCSGGPQTHCWQRAAQLLAQLKPAATEREYEDRFLAYWFLGKAAYLAGDWSDARRLYDLALQIVSNAELASSSKFDPGAMRAVMGVDEAELAMSMEDFAAALGYVDAFAAFQLRDAAQTIEPESAMLLRCGALIGLKRPADACLQALLGKLDFSSSSPWEWMPLSVQVLDPYSTTRRIAAHLMREGKYDQALAVLENLELARTSTLARFPNQPLVGKRWAALVSPAEILNDQAAIYLAQGNYLAAEPILLKALVIADKAGGRQLRRTLDKLAELNYRAGRTEQAIAFAIRAEAVLLDNNPARIDPLARTLGFAR